MRRRLLALLAIPILLVALDRAFPPDLSRATHLALLLEDRDSAPLDARLSPDGDWRLPATPSDVDPRYLRLLLATEDRRFALHPGIDPLALARAAWQFASERRIVSGGSTLTMQVARLLMPHRRTLPGKLIEIVRALQLEERLSKRRILSLYLTLAPMGGNLEGVRAGSLAWFGHLPDHLTDEEAALLVALPRSPSRFRPDRHPDRARRAIARVLARADLPSDDLDRPRRHPFPHLAPRLAERIGGNGLLRTTLDADLQTALDRLAASYAAAQPDGGRLAAIVIRNADRAVLAYAASTPAGGPGDRIDLLRAVRSPGSSLKPLIYAIAFDDDLLTPDTLLPDSPVRLGAWSPHDFDGAFRGTVTAREALQQSLNAPAVRILDRLGAPRFAASLAAAGVPLTLPPGPATVPIALGGVGISPEHLATLYAGLADDGRVAPLRFRPDAPVPAIPLVSPRAARAVADILRGVPPPDGVAPPNRPIAYKTGTSFGFRDAWSAGFSPNWTVVVWTGRPDGTPRPGHYGREAAAPILFRLFDLLPPEPDAIAPTRAIPAPSLARFDDGRPAIIFPPPDATLDVSATDDPAIALDAAGGAPPYRWIVDGLPLPAPAGTTRMNWRPAGIGFSHLTVIDADGRAASADVLIR